MLHEYTSDDEDQVVEMIIQFYNHLADSAQVERWIDQKTALKTLSDWVDDDLVYTHKEAGDVLALARLREDHGTFWVEDLVVREDRRGKGIARLYREDGTGEGSQGAVPGHCPKQPAVTGLLPEERLQVPKHN